MVEGTTASYLANLLAQIAEHDTDYDVRYGLVLNAVAVAHGLGYSAGFRIDPTEPSWPVAYIELPTGQVSWHMPEHEQPWDGHSTEEKYDRIQRYRALPTPCPHCGRTSHGFACAGLLRQEAAEQRAEERRRA